MGEGETSHERVGLWGRALTCLRMIKGLGEVSA